MVPILPVDPVVAQESAFKAFMNMPSSAYYFRIKEVIVLITYF